MSLPASWVDALFGRMMLRYAQAFERNYAGMDLAVVKADWAQVLDGVSAQAISYALVNLPLDWPPNAMQFKALCVRGAREPQSELPALPPPKPDPQRLKDLFSRWHEIAADRRPTDWIGDLEARIAKGEHLSLFQKNCIDQARANLGWDTGKPIEITDADKTRTEELKAEAARLFAEYQERNGAPA